MEPKITTKNPYFPGKASRDFIPTEVNLMSHHISILGECSSCRFHRASTRHCLIFCNVGKHVWKKTSFWGCLKSHSNANFLIVLYISPSSLTRMILSCLRHFVGLFGGNHVKGSMIMMARFRICVWTGHLIFLMLFMLLVRSVYYQGIRDK